MSYPQFFPQLPQQQYQFEPYAENEIPFDGLGVGFGNPVYAFQSSEPLPSFLNDRLPLMSTTLDDTGNTAEGCINEADFLNVVSRYISDLSEKKRDKALITLARYQHIRGVLSDPKATVVESAQFRFWAKRMFMLEKDGQNPQRRVCHDGKPVAIKEVIYTILTNAHLNCRHGGRDKTSEKVRQHYSWVPKELIARYVKCCPTCRIRRGQAEDDDGMESMLPDPDIITADAAAYSDQYQQQIIPHGLQGFTSY